MHAIRVCYDWQQQAIAKKGSEVDEMTVVSRGLRAP